MLIEYTCTEPSEPVMDRRTAVAVPSLSATLSDAPSALLVNARIAQLLADVTDVRNASLGSSAVTAWSAASGARGGLKFMRYEVTCPSAVHTRLVYRSGASVAPGRYQPGWSGSASWLAFQSARVAPRPWSVPPAVAGGAAEHAAGVGAAPPVVPGGGDNIDVTDGTLGGVLGVAALPQPVSNHANAAGSAAARVGLTSGAARRCRRP